jgi:hypothetical protein
MLCDKNGECFSDSKIAEKFKTVPLALLTFSRRVIEMADNVLTHCVVS